MATPWLLLLWIAAAGGFRVGSGFSTLAPTGDPKNGFGKSSVSTYPRILSQIKKLGVDRQTIRRNPSYPSCSTGRYPVHHRRTRQIGIDCLLLPCIDAIDHPSFNRALARHFSAGWHAAGVSGDLQSTGRTNICCTPICSQQRARRFWQAMLRVLRDRSEHLMAPYGPAAAACGTRSNPTKSPVGLGSLVRHSEYRRSGFEAAGDRPTQPRCCYGLEEPALIELTQSSLTGHPKVNVVLPRSRRVHDAFGRRRLSF